MQPGSTTPKSTVVRVTNGALTVSAKGNYELLTISDAHCPGTVSSTSKTFVIDWLAKPSVQLAENAGKLVKNGSLVRAPICEGIEDTAGVVFQGES